jgi:hypothetical protein
MVQAIKLLVIPNRAWQNPWPGAAAAARSSMLLLLGAAQQFVPCAHVAAALH